MKRPLRALLTFLVRGRRERGGPWGEAMLAEFDEVEGNAAALRWAAGGVRVAVREMPGPYKILAAAIVLAVTLTLADAYALTPRYMPSGAMEPTLPVAGRFLVDKIGFRMTGLHRGDIVEFTTPGAGTHSIKRILGLPGDRIECRAGRLLRDGTPVDEPYLQAGARTDCTPTTVGDNELYVLGDHREISADSRQSGTIPQSAVDGRLLLTFG
jgi:signal peptidase I